MFFKRTNTFLFILNLEIFLRIIKNKTCKIKQIVLSLRVQYPEYNHNILNLSLFTLNESNN